MACSAADVAAERAVGTQHPVTRNDDREGIGRAGRADRADSSRIADQLSDLPVAAGLAIADLGQMPLHQLAESVRQRQIQRKVETPGGAG